MQTSPMRFQTPPWQTWTKSQRRGAIATQRRERLRSVRPDPSAPSREKWIVRWDRENEHSPLATSTREVGPDWPNVLGPLGPFWQPWPSGTVQVVLWRPVRSFGPGNGRTCIALLCTDRAKWPLAGAVRCLQGALGIQGGAPTHQVRSFWNCSRPFWYCWQSIEGSCFE